MVKRRVIFTFSVEIIREPIIYTLSQQFNVVTNILRADISENSGWIVIELDGTNKDIEQCIDWVIGRGIRVDPIDE
ncbi:NIL domain-containing protein [Chloroflexota bacterium]